MTSLDKSKRSRINLWVFVFLLASYCSWIFTLPLFPSLDGPLHLYYASVLASLLSGAHRFSNYYFIRHILPPYALHYYFLIATAHFVGYVIADKLMICFIFLVTAWGFRYLAVYLGPSGDLVSLLIVPLLLNWPLGMGFYNYCLSIGLSLWALGMWYRAVAQRSHKLWLGFLTMVALMVLTHPVPVLCVYALVGLDVVSRVREALATRRLQPNGIIKEFKCDIAYLLLAWSTVFYVLPFMGRSRIVSNILQHYDRKALLLKFLKLSNLAMFSGSQPAVLVYRLSLYATLALSILWGLKGTKQKSGSVTFTPARTLLASSLVLLCLIPILPPVMNGANYFSQRLVVLVWIGALAGASAHVDFRPNLRLKLTTIFILYAMAVLLFANFRIRPTAVQMEEIETARISRTGMTGLILSLPDAPDPSGLNYVPYYWAATRYFRRSRSTLLNGGWLYEYYLPLGSRLEDITNQFPPVIQDSPGDAYQLLLHSDLARAQVMPHANIVVFTGYEPRQQLLAILRQLDGGKESRSWQCRQENWYAVCTTSLPAPTSV
jgi:hypothetical protein